MSEVLRLVCGAAALVLVLSAQLTGAGCVATETGNPSATLDPTTLDGEVLPDEPMLPSPPTLAIRGRAGSVEPADGQVLAWALGNNLPPEAASVQPDGSFSLTVSALPGELVRIQVRRADGGFSEPLDLWVSADAGLMLWTPANPCLRIEPARVLVVEGSAAAEFTIRVNNDCATPVVRSRARLRSEAVGLALVDEGPLEMAPSTRVDLRVRVEDMSSTLEDIVLLSVSSPEPELRAVSFMVR